MKFTKTGVIIASIATAAGIAIGVGTGVAVASATAPVSNAYGCVTGSSRTLEHVYTVAGNFKSCPAGSFAVTIGAPPMTAGPSGLSINDNPNAPYAIGIGPTVTDYCPSQEPYVIGGGFAFRDPATSHLLTSGVPLVSSMAAYGPNGQQGWTVTIGSTPNKVEVDVQAFCSK